MSKPHIDLMNRGIGPSSIDYISSPAVEKLSTCPCDNCLDMYKKIHGKDSPLEYRAEKEQLPVPATPQATTDNGWTCPKSQAQPSPEIETLIKRAPWSPGKVYHSQDGITPDIDGEGNYFLPNSIHHHIKQFTEMK
jgi:hypothetical protein